ncbi:MAG: hypothetical protein ACSLEZ_15025 [Thiobacillus sp.]
MGLLRDVSSAAMTAFIRRCGDPRVQVYEQSTEELQHEMSKGKSEIKLYARGLNSLAAGRGAKARLEENYLFDTRRFASGAQLAGSNLFFANAVGLPGANNGFVAPMVMSYVETNMVQPSQVPQGRDFVLWNLGISFNTQIANADAALIMEMGHLKFIKQGGQFTLHHGPGRMWPGGTGITNSSVTINAANGSPDIRATRKLAVPRVIRAVENFNYSYDVPRTVSNLDNSTAISLTGNCLMTVWLWGGQQDSIPV